MALATYEQVLAAAEAVAAEGDFGAVLFFVGGPGGVATVMTNIMSANATIGWDGLRAAAKAALSAGAGLGAKLGEFIDLVVDLLRIYEDLNDGVVEDVSENLNWVLGTIRTKKHLIHISTYDLIAKGNANVVFGARDRYEVARGRAFMRLRKALGVRTGVSGMATSGR